MAGCDVSCLTTLLEANWKQNYTKKSLQCYALLLLFFFFQGLSKPNVDTSFFCPKNRQNASASRLQHNSWERQQNKKPHGIASFLNLDFINYTQQIKCHLFQAFSKQIHLFYFQKFAWLEFGFFFFKLSDVSSLPLWVLSRWHQPLTAWINSSGPKFSNSESSKLHRIFLTVPLRCPPPL